MLYTISRIFLLILIAALGYGITQRFYSRLPRALKRVIWVLSSIAALLCFFSHLGLLDLISVAWSIRYMTHIGLEFTAFFVGVFSGLVQIRTNVRHKARGIVTRHNGTVLAAFLLVPFYMHPILMPPKYKFVDKWKDGVCMQSTGQSCGPACVTTMLTHYGIAKKEEDLIRPLFLSSQGTAAWAMARYLKKRGFGVKILKTSERPENIPVPSIALVRLGNREGIAHCIIILEETETHFTIADSLSGRFVWTKDYAYTHYYFEGYLIHVTK